MDRSPLTQGERLRTLIKQLKITQVRMAQVLGINSKFVSHMVTNRRRVTEGMALKIELAYPMINTAWLLQGTGGPMKEHAHLTQSSTATPELLKRSSPLTLEEVTTVLLGILERLENIEQRLAALEQGKK